VKKKMSFPIRSRAYVANIHDCVNYDVEILTENLPQNVDNLVESTMYQYVKIREEDYLNGIINVEERIITGKAYKCRLHGVGIRQKKNKPIDLLNLSHDVIFECDGYVDIIIYGVDSYSRLLIDIRTPNVPSLRELLVTSKSVFRYR
jgi:hypothetical protein